MPLSSSIYGWRNQDLQKFSTFFKDTELVEKNVKCFSIDFRALKTLWQYSLFLLDYELFRHYLFCTVYSASYYIGYLIYHVFLNYLKKYDEVCLSQLLVYSKPYQKCVAKSISIFSHSWIFETDWEPANLVQAQLELAASHGSSRYDLHAFHSLWTIQLTWVYVSHDYDRSTREQTPPNPTQPNTSKCQAFFLIRPYKIPSAKVSYMGKSNINGAREHI